MLTVAVLGPIELRRDGTQVVVPGGRTAEVLVRLALDAGTPVRSEQLIEDLWSSHPAGVARNTLQSKVSRLRRALGDPGLLTGGPTGYMLAVDPESVDALAVLRLAVSAPVLRRAGDAAGAAAACGDALAMFHGEILPDGGEGAWLAPWRARLEEVRVQLTEDQVAARMDLGAGGEVVAELEGLVELHPLREGLWTLLITALYAAGRQSDALAAYHRVQQQLDHELAVEPGVDLQQLHLQVLRHDGALHVNPPRGRPAGRPPVGGNLPGVSASLFGRAADLAEMAALLEAERLVTVVGPAGVGKTRSAVEAARTTGRPGGCWFVRLEDARSAASVWQAVGEAFGINSATEPMVLDRLRGGALLLVLDNCEHLLDDVAAQVGRMLAAAPALQVLATSQMPLAIDGEAVHPLAPLALDDAVELFAARAAQQRRSFVMDDDTVKVVDEVCRSLDGLPLAIELAAARIKVLSVEEIARRMVDRFTVLRDPTGRHPPRQRTLEGAIAWSYDLLFPDDQVGLWALACFSGGAPLDAVEEVLAALGVPPDAAIDVLARLADRSLLTTDADVDGTVRFRLLDSVRAFSTDRLRAAGMLTLAQGAHAAWVAELAGRIADGVRGPAQATLLSSARAERGNIELAMAWAASHDPLIGLRIAIGIGWAWVVMGAGPHGAQRIRAAVAATRGLAADRDRRHGWRLAGWLEASGGDLDLAAADIEHALAGGDATEQHVGQLHLSFVRTQQRRPADALTLLARCRPAFREVGLPWEEAAAWLLTSWAEIAGGNTGGASTACAEAVRLLDPIGDAWAMSHVQGMLGGLALSEHRFGEATAHLTHAADAAHALGFGAAEAYHLTTLGRAHSKGGDDRSATVELQRAISVSHTAGDPRGEAMARVHLARALRRLGDGAAARTTVQPAHDWYRQAGGGDGAALAQLTLATLDADERAPEAHDRLAVVLSRAQDEHDLEVEVLTLDAVARLHAEEGRTHLARDALRTADGAARQAGHLITDDDRLDGARARALLGGSVS